MLIFAIKSYFRAWELISISEILHGMEYGLDFGGGGGVIADCKVVKSPPVPGQMRAGGTLLDGCIKFFGVNYYNKLFR